MRRFSLSLLLLALTLLAASAAMFAQSAGKVDRLLPAGFIARGSNSSEAKQADLVQWNDILRTNDQGRMRVALDDGSMLSIGAHSELRVVKHDTQSNQTLVEMLYGKARANVVPIRKNGGSFQVRTPTAVIGVLGTTVTVETTLVDNSQAQTVTTVTSQDIQNLPGPRQNISDLLQLTPGAMPDKSAPDTPTIADYTTVDGTIVGSLDHIVGVRSIDPSIVKMVFLLPGQYTLRRSRPAAHRPAVSRRLLRQPKAEDAEATRTLANRLPFSCYHKF
ncbi:MAG: FecR domain-containing protein [Acidobacteriota bacterium]|nr:FecR domain-containing protein [Acidobacteriota bacterium]